MGTIKSCETPTLAEALRAQRCTTQADQDEVTRQHDADALPAEDRLSALTH